MLEDNWEIAVMIDERVGQLTRDAVSDTVLINRMLGYMPALHRLWTSAPDEELAADGRQSKLPIRLRMSAMEPTLLASCLLRRLWLQHSIGQQLLEPFDLTATESGLR